MACSQMCGRFLSSTPVSVLAEQFLAAEVTAEEREPRYNVAPTDQVLAVATTRGVRRLGTLSWGLVPSWADAAAGGRRMVNLRSETAAERPDNVRNDGPSLIEPVDPAQLDEQTERRDGFVEMLPFGADDPPMR